MNDMDIDEDIVLRHLLEAKAELLRKRLGVDAEIQDVDRLITARRTRADRSIRVHLRGGALRDVDFATVMPGGTLVIGEMKGRKGGWRVEAEGSGLASRVFLTKAEAIMAARAMVAGTGPDTSGEGARLIERTVDDVAGVTDQAVVAVAANPKPVDKPFTGEPPKTVHDAVVRVLNSEDRDFQAAEIVMRVHAMGLDATEGSIRSIVSRVVRDGLAIKGTSGRSSYRAAPSQPAARVVRDPDGSLRIVGVEGGIFALPTPGDQVWGPEDAYEGYEPPDPADQDWEPSEDDLIAEAEVAAEREAERQAEDDALFSKYGGTKVTFSGEEYLLMDVVQAEQAGHAAAEGVGPV